MSAVFDGGFSASCVSIIIAAPTVAISAQLSSILQEAKTSGNILKSRPMCLRFGSSWESAAPVKLLSLIVWGGAIRLLNIRNIRSLLLEEQSLA
jgi:hypothetical protein